MYYFWKFLSIINGFLIVVLGLPLSLMVRLQFWLKRKMNPDYDPMLEMMQQAMSKMAQQPTEQHQTHIQEMEKVASVMGAAIAEAMKQQPKQVEEVKATVDKALAGHVVKS